MAVNKVIYGDQTLIDITDTTAQANDVMSGEVFYNAAGVRSVGSLGLATSENAGLMSAEDKEKLDSIDIDELIAVPPLAADGTRGGVQIGYTDNGQNYGVQLSNEQMYVHVPWTDNDTKNTAGATDTSSRIYLIGATEQGINPQTYSHDTVYIDTDGYLYCQGQQVLLNHQSLAGYAPLTGATFSGNLVIQKNNVNIRLANNNLTSGTNTSYIHSDVNGAVGGYEMAYKTDGSIITGFYARNYDVTNSQYYDYNGLYMTISKTGSVSYQVSGKEAFRAAISAAADAEVVHLLGNEVISGTKTFTGERISQQFTTVDLSKANNGIINNAEKNFTFEDNANRRFVFHGGLAKSNGTVVASIGVKNYLTDTSAMSDWQGITISMDKSGIVSYTVATPSAFRTAIGVGASGTHDDSYFLKTTGGTLTGSLILKQSAIDLTSATNDVTSATSYGYSIKDKNDYTFALFQGVALPSGTAYAYMGVQNRDTDGNAKGWGGLLVSSDKAGNIGYSVTDAAAFRTAIGLYSDVDNYATLSRSPSTATQLIGFTGKSGTHHSNQSSYDNHSFILMTTVNGLFLWDNTASSTVWSSSQWLKTTGGTLTGTITLDYTGETTAAYTNYNALILKYKTSNNENTYTVYPIRYMGTPETTTANNATILLGSTSGDTWIHAGESAAALASKLQLSANEELHFASDGGFDFYATASNSSPFYAYKMRYSTSNILALINMSVDLTDASNGVSASTTVGGFYVEDAGGRVVARTIGHVLHSTYSAGPQSRLYLQAQNYNGSTATGYKGLIIEVNKDGTVAYDIASPANFRSTLGFPTAGTANDITYLRNDYTWHKMVRADVNTLINLLATGTSALTADDYIITQYAGGGTTTTDFYRRAAKYVRVGGLTTARTLTIGETGKSFDGTANVSWSAAEVLGSSSSSYFWRGDQSWSTGLDNNMYLRNNNVDITKSNNNASTNTNQSYARYFYFYDTNNRLIARIAGYSVNNGRCRLYLSAYNWYKASDEDSASNHYGGIYIEMDKSGEVRYSVTNSENFRSAISAGTSSLIIGTTATTAAAGNHTHSYIPLSGGTTTGEVKCSIATASAITGFSVENTKSGIAHKVCMYCGTTGNAGLYDSTNSKWLLYSTPAGSICTGTITTGVWNATEIGIAYGGTGMTAVSSTSTIADIATAATGNTITSASYAYWGKLATLALTVTVGTAVTSNTTATTIATTVSGKRPKYASVAIRHGSTYSARITAGGVVQVYGAITANASVTVYTTFLLA